MFGKKKLVYVCVTHNPLIMHGKDNCVRRLEWRRKIYRLTFWLKNYGLIYCGVVGSSGMGLVTD